MREILFRGKRLDYDVWEEGYYSPMDLPSYDAEPVDMPCIIRKKDLLWCKVDPNTVGQYTGLTDKNGNRIFEGDICQIKNHRLITDTPFVVEWEDFVYNGWTWRDLDDDGSVDSFTTGAANYCEIIGNIHDNPELLGGVEA